MFRIRSASFIALVAGLTLTAHAWAAGEPLKTITPQPSGGMASSFNGVVEAVRQTVVAAQVSGAIVRLDVRVGDSVRAGQVLLQIDARVAEQAAAASSAQVQSARASLEVATREFERQKQLFRKNYISQAALERAELEFKATRAQVAAQGAQAGAARTQSGLHVIRAPYAGIVSEVPVSLGDMAMPGRILVTVYDPAALRITAAIPQTVAAQMAADHLPRVELPDLPTQRQWVAPVRMQMLPTADAATHTVQLRAELPAGLDGVVPGMFARIWLPPNGAGAKAGGSLSVPMSAVVRRAELTGLYVLDAEGRPLLRQVRLGRVEGGNVEILSGLAPGERVAADPEAAVRIQRALP